MTPLTAGRLDALRAKDFGDFPLAPGAPKTRDKMRQMLSAADGLAATMPVLA